MCGAKKYIVIDINVYVVIIKINEVKINLVIKSSLFFVLYVDTNFTILELIPKFAIEATDVVAIISDHTPNNLTPI